MNNLPKQESIFKALADKNRIRILKMLQNKSLCVCEITDTLKLAASTVSNHLKILTKTGLIISFKEGKWINYSINPHPENNLLSSVLLYLQFVLEDDDTIIKDRKAILKVDRNVLCGR